jgi:hypothetical protein
MYNKGTPAVLQMLLHMIYSHWLMAPSRKIEHSWNRPLYQIISWSCWQQQLDGCGAWDASGEHRTIRKTRPTTSAVCACRTEFDITLWSLQSSHVLRSLLYRLHKHRFRDTVFSIPLFPCRLRLMHCSNGNCSNIVSHGLVPDLVYLHRHHTPYWLPR